MDHKFSDESKNILEEFLNAQERNKSSRLCNMRQYEIWKSFTQDTAPTHETEQKCDSPVSIQEVNCALNSYINNENASNFELRIQSSSHSDIAASIKEYLENEARVPDNLFIQMKNCSQEKIKEIFQTLSGELTSKQIVSLGECVSNFVDDYVAKQYCCFLLFKEMTIIFLENMKILFLKFCDRFEGEIVPHIVDSLLCNDNIDTLLFYFNATKLSFQEMILRELLKRSQELFLKKYLLVMDCLIHQGVQPESLKDSVELLALHTKQFVKDKEYGKLLLKLMKYLGTDSASLKKPIQHILTHHNSIWKVKLQKEFNSHCENSVLLYQSVRME